MSSDPKFRLAIELIDQANSQDPIHILVDGQQKPKELVHSEMITEWVKRLCPNPSPALLIAARAHHIRRWEIPRSSYSKGRRPYLQWRTALHKLHAKITGDILGKVGYEDHFIARVQTILQKHNLRQDADVQTLEDALCLVFLETQFSALRLEHGNDKLHDIIVKTLGKMGAQAKEFALQIQLAEEERDLLERAVAD